MHPGVGDAIFLLAVRVYVVCAREEKERWLL